MDSIRIPFCFQDKGFDFKQWCIISLSRRKYWKCYNKKKNCKGSLQPVIFPLTSSSMRHTSLSIACIQVAMELFFIVKTRHKKLIRSFYGNVSYDMDVVIFTKMKRNHNICYIKMHSISSIATRFSLIFTVWSYRPTNT